MARQGVPVLTSMIAAALLASCGPENVENRALHLDFDDFATGDFSVGALLNHLRLVAKPSRPVRVVLDEGGSKVLRVDYPQGRVGPRDSGVLFVIGIPPTEEYYLSYRVKLDDNFDFRNGGKLPGLSSMGCVYSGGRIPTNGDGWSARLWWGQGGITGVYLYHAGMAGPWGDLFRLSGGPLRKNEWYTFIQRVRLNTGAAADGILQVWLNGVLALDRRDVKYRTDGQGRIESLCFSTFHGGSDPAKFGPTTTGNAVFDDIVIDADVPDALQHAPPATTMR